MKRQSSRRKFLRTGSCALGAATLHSGLASLVSSTVSSTVAAQTTDSAIERVDLGYAWVLQGAGCNVFTLPGMNEDGALMVDGGLAAQSDALLAAVFDVTGQSRVHTLINTHFHPEPTGSHVRLGADGEVIIAHDNTKMCLQNAVMSALFDGRYGPLADAGIPNMSIGSSGSLKFAGQEIIYGYLPAAHTNGDIWLYFPILDTLIAGGPVTTDRWPVLDIRQGAWMGGLLRAYETLSQVVSADTIVVPAHGPLTNGTEILRMRAMYTLIHLELAEQLNLGM